MNIDTKFPWKKVIPFLLLLSSISSLILAQEKEVTRHYQPDKSSLLRNPAMGWVIYEEGWSFQPDNQEGKAAYTPESFWEELEQIQAPDYANILYIRIPWKYLEPEKGQYAWLYNKSYQNYIQRARSHGLKLAFRVFFHGGVPEYVYQAGAEHTAVDGEGKIQPYYDDSIFLKHLERFIEAFAKEYDNPDVVDFIDAYGLGRWGEGHGVTLRDPQKLGEVMKRVTETYAKNFRHVLTVMNLSAADYRYSKPYVYDRLGFLPRRDGLGSFWYTDEERGFLLRDLFPAKAFIGESCYWFNKPSWKEENYSQHKIDKRFAMANIKEALTVALTDALENHSNTMDLRVPQQCHFWIKQLPEQVQRFIEEGGYRFYPDFIHLKQDARLLTLWHSWRNLGVGLLPNGHPNWGHKYHLSFALIDKQGRQSYIQVEDNIDPGEWLKGQNYVYASTLRIPVELKGKFQVCVAITDAQKNNKASIELAVPEKDKYGKWVKITDILL